MTMKLRLSQGGMKDFLTRLLWTLVLSSWGAVLVLYVSRVLH